MPRFCVILFFAFISFAAKAQPVVFINAGSRASYGHYQELIIEANGQSSFRYREANGAIKDSSRFTITRTQLDSFFRKADATGFFLLEAKYDSGAADGSGIYISMNNAGRKHAVSVLNSDVPAVNDLINWLNEMLAAYRIRIYYGQNIKQ